MQRSSQTPPPLYHSPLISDSSDRGRESSATSENTPLSTPTVPEAPWPAKKEKDLYFSWHKKQDGAKRNSNPILDNWSDFQPDPAEPLFEDDGDHAFPLFPDSPPPFPKRSMASATPVDIQLPPRLSSSQSPRNQMSTLTSALQEAGATGQKVPEVAAAQYMGIQEAGRLSVSGKHDLDSINFGSSYYGTDARPISFKDRPRRESNTAGSLMTGMSWGGISVGSLKNEIMMTGTSPMILGRSPSVHSASYFPKMEAQFLRDFECCGTGMDSLHDLLQHFEEHHAQQSNQILPRSSLSSQGGFLSGRRSSNGAGQSQSATSAASSATKTGLSNSGFSRTQLSTVQDMDSLEDMEMDETNTAAQTPVPQLTSPAMATPHHLITPRMTPTVPAQQAFRTATPSAPNPNTAFQLYSNPTVSSVNTPAMSTQPLPQQTFHTSMPATGGTDHIPEFNTNFFGSMGTGMGALDMGMPGAPMLGDDFFNPVGFGLANTMSDMTIDEPAKRLFSRASGLSAHQIMAMRNGQLPTDGELQKQMREQQLIGGLGGTPIGFPEAENKPFKCPVIGCEKAYKNQNGLKYHKVHGHNTQMLQTNADGTYSIINPDTSAPYPGNQGMEKEKPYSCDKCGKRYKNLNGLKYHKQHTARCDPERVNTLQLAGLNPMANVAGNLF